MHWGSATLAGRGSAGINAVTAKSCCPVSKQPELKHAAVRIAKVDLPWRLCAFGYPASEEQTAALRDELRVLASVFEYASIVLIGRERAGVLLRAAATEAIDGSRLAAIDRCFALDGPSVARYDDARRGVSRRIATDAGRLRAVRLAGDVAPERWLREWLVAGEEVAGHRASLLFPSASPPSGYRSRGRVVCNCFDVSETEILEALAALSAPADVALARLQALHRCGTQCGSCLPELKRMAAKTQHDLSNAPEAA
jgi:assimilatory nitrate reductase catalytic subunit